MTQTRGRAIVILFATAAVLAVVAVVMIETTPGEGANIGAGLVLLLAMVVALVATVATVATEQGARARDRGPGLGRPTLTRIAVGAAGIAVLGAVVGGWSLAIAAVIPATVCGWYASRARIA